MYLRQTPNSIFFSVREQPGSGLKNNRTVSENFYDGSLRLLDAEKGKGTTNIHPVLPMILNKDRKKTATIQRNDYESKPHNFIDVTMGHQGTSGWKGKVHT